MEINYMDVDFSTSHWTSLEMIKSYIEQRPLDKEDILLHINNTIEFGYILMDVDKLESIMEEYSKIF